MDKNRAYTAEDGVVVIPAVTRQGKTKLISDPAQVWDNTASLSTTDYTLPGDAALEDGSIGILSIPALGLSAPVYETEAGGEMESMTKGIAHFAVTSSWDGNIGLCSHNVAPAGAVAYFRDIHQLKKTFRFTDINYQVASREDKERMFLGYGELLGSLDSGATAKLTIRNHRLHRMNLEDSLFMGMKGNKEDEYRQEYNRVIADAAINGNGIRQEKYFTISAAKQNIDEARGYFTRIESDLSARFAALGSRCGALDTNDRLRILHDFYRAGEESDFWFDAEDMAGLGHDFRDYICPDSIEKHSDYLKLGERYCRVLFLKDYASYIKDSFVTELTDLRRNMMLSIDIIPIPTDEAVREVETRLLGVETNITNWQRKQNQNNNFSAIVPYDLEQQRRESKEFLDDLTTRDQRMMIAVLTMAITADTKEQLDADTETILTIARKHMCQMLLLFAEY